MRGEISKERHYPSVPELDPEKVVYMGRSSALAGIDPAMAGRVGIVINVGDARCSRDRDSPSSTCIAGTCERST